MMPAKDMIPLVAANLLDLTPWEQGFVNSIHDRISRGQSLSRKQHDRLAVIHTRLEVQGPRAHSRKRK